MIIYAFTSSGIGGAEMKLFIAGLFLITWAMMYFMLERSHDTQLMLNGKINTLVQYHNFEGM